MFGINERLQQAAAESDDERAERLRESGQEAGVDPETLYRVELMVEDAVAHAATENNEEIQAYMIRLRDAGLPVDTLFGGVDSDTVATLFSKAATNDPEATAEFVAAANGALRQSGLYDELDIDPTEATLPAEIDVGE